MADEQQQAIDALTDDELKAIADSPEMVSKLTSSERRRMVALTPAQTSKPNDASGLMARMGAGALPKIASATADFATSPTAPKVGATIGRVIGGAAPIIGGAVKGGAGGAAIGTAGAAHGAWAGGKTGYFTTKLLQSMASPVAGPLMQAAGPVSKALGAASGALGVGDLASMAEPNRMDTTILGKSMSNDDIMGILQRKAAAGDRNAQQSLAYLQSIGK